MVLTLLFFTFIAVICVQFFYYVIVFGKFSFAKTPKSFGMQIPISIIVCAKNEAANLENFVPKLLEQDYANFEIVLIDDSSTDGTLKIIEDFAQQHHKIKVVKVVNNEAFWGNKKYALTLGIKAATYEHLLFIDADCYPNSANWITQMAAQFTNRKSIVLGYGAKEKDSTFLNKLIRFETMLSATQYFSWAKFGNPYMGVGRNLAYTKTEFFNAGGFINHMKIRSGDDDLFVNQVSTESNTAICVGLESFTFTTPKKSFKKWFDQKRRHISTATHYKTFDKFQLATFFISQLSFILLAIILLAFQFNWIIVLSLIGFRYIFSWISLGFSAGKLKEKDVMYFYPVIEIVLLFTHLNLFFTNLVSKPVSWK